MTSILRKSGTLALLPGCPEGSWLCERFGALSLNWRDLFGKRARRSGGLGKRHGTGPSKRVRTARNASFPRRAARGGGKLEGPLAATGEPCGGPGGAREPHRNASSRFLRRAAQEQGGALRRGGAETLWNRGDAFWGLGARKFPRRPQGTQGIG